MGGSYLFGGSTLEKKLENFGKTAVFPGGFGRIGEIPHWRIWPDWGLYGNVGSDLQ